MVALGDYLFWQREQWAGVQGLFGLVLVTTLIVARPAVIADRRAAIEAAVAACVREGAATADVGGSLTTAASGDAVCQRLRFD